MYNQNIRTENSNKEEALRDEVLFWKEYIYRRIEMKNEFAMLRPQNALGFAQHRLNAYLLNS